MRCEVAMATFVFPGQGAQRIGMAREVRGTSSIVAATFEEASRALGFDLSEACETPRVNETELTQPAVVAVSVALARAFQAATGIAPSSLAGHSLGELSALTVAGVVPFDSVLRIARRRGELMQSACGDDGAMVALVQKPLQLDLIERVAAAHEVALANHNSPSQVVLSGPRARLDTALEELRASCAKPRLITIPLKVSAAFHSAAMRTIEEPFRETLEREAERFDAAPSRRVFSNAFDRFYDGSKADLIAGLVSQLAAPVRWLRAMDELTNAEQPIVEIGPSAPLARFFREIGVTIRTVTDTTAIDAWDAEEAQ